MLGKFKTNPKTGTILVMGNEIGKGHHGTVYLSTYYIAEYPREVFFACKHILTKNLNILKKRKLHDEISIHLSLNNKHIVKLYEYFEDYTNMYMILENCIGDLTQISCNFVKRKKYLYETLLGLQYLHNNDIIHRDIKPHNILIKNNTAKIADFGHSVRYCGQLFYDFPNTPNYVAPEIITNIGHSFPADIWSYGATFYWVMTHNAPFEGYDALSTYNNIINVKYDTTILFPDERELLAKIFIVDPAKRINIMEIYGTKFFAKINSDEF